MFKPENDLETMMLDAAIDSSKRPAFYKRFIEGTVLVLDNALPSVASVPAARRNPSFRMLEIDGVPHCPVYSSTVRAADHGHREGYFHEVRTRALLQRMRDVPVVLNPGSKPCKIFSREEVAGLLDGSLLAPIGGEDKG